ncbi:hypothetical protein [Megasphaera sp.]|uniref:hypothetical protein n=1 Tax=Megasphaera sp. TaxID=2023260 RepID=UPI00266F26BE|nr:hypothetical protein [uncultured Megasphaera sp.]
MKNRFLNEGTGETIIKQIRTETTWIVGLVICQEQLSQLCGMEDDYLSTIAITLLAYFMTLPIRILRLRKKKGLLALYGAGVMLALGVGLWLCNTSEERGATADAFLSAGILALQPVLSVLSAIVMILFLLTWGYTLIRAGLQKVKDSEKPGGKRLLQKLIPQKGTMKSTISFIGGLFLIIGAIPAFILAVNLVLTEAFYMLSSGLTAPWGSELNDAIVLHSKSLGALATPVALVLLVQAAILTRPCALVLSYLESAATLWILWPIEKDALLEMAYQTSLWAVHGLLLMWSFCWSIGLGVVLAEISWERFQSFRRRHSRSREEDSR